MRLHLLRADNCLRAIFVVIRPFFPSSFMSGASSPCGFAELERANNGRLGQDLEQCQIKDRECPNNRVGYACPWRGNPNQQTVSYKSLTEKRNERPKIGRINYRECAKRRKRNSRKSIDIRSRLRRSILDKFWPGWIELVILERGSTTRFSISFVLLMAGKSRRSRSGKRSSHVALEVPAQGRSSVRFKGKI